MRQECILDFTGVDVVSAADDHVRSSVLQEQESFGVELTDVTGVNPAVFGEGVRIQFRCIEVSGDRRWRADHDFTRFSMGHFVSLAVEQA